MLHRSAAVRLFSVLSFGLALGASPAARAEFVRIEPAAAQAADGVASLLEGRTAVVASRATDRTPPPWAFHEAVAVELTAALRTRGVEAVRAASHPATDGLSRGTAGFTAADARRAKAAGRDVLVAVEVSAGAAPRAFVAFWPADGGQPLGRIEVDLPRESLELAGNVPDLNRKVVEFCRGKLGTACGDGVCATLGGEALAAAGAERTGIYTWGRELDDQEPVLPGDILQLERVELKGTRFSRSYDHHTAVVEEVRPDAVVVLHQNVAPKGKVVQRDVWPVSADRTGIVQAYRPWKGESPLPPVSPRRREPAKVVKRGETVDLLRTLDPRLDSVKGIWWRDGGLRWNRDTFARLQLPADVPEQYTLRLKVRRLVGDDQVSIGLVVGGRQTALSIDAYRGTKTGLNTLDGKKPNDNESTYTGPSCRPRRSSNWRSGCGPTRSGCSPTASRSSIGPATRRGSAWTSGSRCRGRTGCSWGVGTSTAR